MTTTTTISRPVQLFALIGVVGAMGFAAFTFLASPGDASTTPLPAAPAAERPASPTRPTPAPTPPAARRPSPTVTRSGFPVPVDRALRQRRVVVVAVYMPRASVDAVVRAEAQAAAASTGAAFVAVSAANEALMRPLVSKVGVFSDPAVLVVRRPGVVVAELGVTDRATVAQAVAQARK